MKNLEMKIFNFLIIFFLIGICISAQNLKPGDGVKISFFNIQDSIKGNYYVLENGEIQFPYIGLISTVNKDFPELKTEIISEYSKLYKNPELNVQPLIRISVLGEVGNPGIYYLSGFEKVSDILSLAGGESSDSNIENIYIIRDGSKIEIDLESFLIGDDSLSDIEIMSGDKIYVPRTWWVGARDVSVIVSGLAVVVTIASLFSN